MNIINKIKKITIIALAAILFTTGIAFSGAQVEAQAATNEVSMYYVNNVITNYRGRSQQEIYIKVKNLGFNKSVVVHSTNGDQPGVWTDSAATYIKTLPDGSEIWKVDVAFSGTLTYAIKYAVNGATYWDNNGGKNYTNIEQLGVNPVKNVSLSRYAIMNPAEYQIKACVKNLAYSKSVVVKYTQNNWATTQSKALTYTSSISGTNNEYWGTTLNLDVNKMSTFKYYIQYTVNGVTYYDNNLGTNYNNSFYCPY